MHVEVRASAAYPTQQSTQGECLLGRHRSPQGLEWFLVAEAGSCGTIGPFHEGWCRKWCTFIAQNQVAVLVSGFKWPLLTCLGLLHHTEQPLSISIGVRKDQCRLGELAHLNKSKTHGGYSSW